MPQDTPKRMPPLAAVDATGSLKALQGNTMKKDIYAPLREEMKQAPEFWKSVEAKTQQTEVTAGLDVEFPNGTGTNEVNRRDAFKIAGAALSLGALSACQMRRDQEEILPFVRMPEKVIPGVRMMYATAMRRSEGALGLTVEANDGRPTKIEGNPNHSSSLGASDSWAQAEILKLYDPNRARVPRLSGADSSWEKFDAAAKEIAAKFAANQGAGLAFLVEDELGPTVERLLKNATTKMPQAQVFRFDPTAPDHQAQGAQLAFGKSARVHFDLENVNVIFSLDSDFLVTGPDHLKLARQFGTSRAVHHAADVKTMKRLYASEAVFSNTGSNADHRLRLSSAQQIDVLKALVVALGNPGALAVTAGALPENAAKFLVGLVKDFQAATERAVVLVGERQPAEVHALAYALNAALASKGQTVSSGSGEARVSHVDSLAALTKLLQSKAIDTLVMLDVNPVYTAPGALKFVEALSNAKTTIHAGVLPEETGAKSTWHLPLSHFLESWGDARAWDGTASIVQPLILPLHKARAACTLLAQLTGETETHDKKLVEATWKELGLTGKSWRKALHDGVIEKSARGSVAPQLNAAAVVDAVAPFKTSTPSKDALEFIAVQGHLKDGRLSNVSWMMELPDSMSKLCWDNALMVSPALAKEMGLDSQVKRNSYTADIVELTVDGRKISAPTFVLPGLATYSVVMSLGYGRTAGDVASGIGVDANPLLSGPSVLPGVKMTKTGRTVDLCSTQDHFSVPGNPFKEMTFAQMMGESKEAKERVLGLGKRPLFRSGTAAEFSKDEGAIAAKGSILEELLVDETHVDPTENKHLESTPKAPRHGEPHERSARPSTPLQLTDAVVYEGQQWGMVIDLSSCTGCNICTVACVAENNIPAVGREMVLLGREMHWIRIDRYFTGDVEQPLAVHQPVACMHCENAPCEPVCPVAATVHDEEGLNGMAYNRCIGTRYCANNCPFKVRRFNYFDYTHTGMYYVEPKVKEQMKTLKLQRNPDVTVRYRGVMEKCTFCTQRVEEAKVVAKQKGNDRKALPDGAVTPACAQACPTNAITFGNINDEKSRVHELKRSPRNYEMLQELNIRPRTTYLARVRNENGEPV
jgi:Fe-S-cluster-containing dehydrogenase component